MVEKSMRGTTHSLKDLHGFSLQELEPAQIVCLYEKTQRYIVPGYDHLQEEIARLAGRDQSSDFTVLDIGCGTGNLAFELIRKFPEATVVCLDRSSEALNLAKDKLLSLGSARIRFLQMDFVEQPLLGNYNAIVSSFALHHLLESRIPILLEQIHAALLPRGVCWIGDTIHIASIQRSRAIQMRYDQFLQENIAKSHITLDEIKERSNIMQMLGELGFSFFKPIQLPVVLDMFKSAGFTNVQCPYQDGNLAIFGGMKYKGGD